MNFSFLSPKCVESIVEQKIFVFGVDFVRRSMARSKQSMAKAKHDMIKKA